MPNQIYWKFYNQKGKCSDKKFWSFFFFFFFFIFSKHRLWVPFRTASYNDYTSHTPGCVTAMIQDIGWESFQDRRNIARLSPLLQDAAWFGGRQLNMLPGTQGQTHQRPWILSGKTIQRCVLQIVLLTYFKGKGRTHRQHNSCHILGGVPGD